jgi:hypothetical protein
VGLRGTPSPKAIDLLPAEIRPYFQKHLGFTVEHAASGDDRAQVMLPFRIIQ